MQSGAAKYFFPHAYFVRSENLNNRPRKIAHREPSVSMIRSIFYIGLLALGLGTSMFSPVAGAISCIAAYLLNPSVIVGYDTVRFQLWTNVTFLLSYFFHRTPTLKAVGAEGSVLGALCGFCAIALASSVWADYSSEIARNQAIELLKTVVMTVILSRVISTERQMTVVMSACLIGVFHAAVTHTFGVRFGYVPAMYGAEFGVLPEGQGGPLLIFLPTLVLTAMLTAGKTERLLSWIALPFILNSLIVTYRRGVLISLILELFLLFFVLPKRILLRVAPVVLAGVGLFVFRLTPPDYWVRMGTMKAPTEEASANSRFVINEASMRMLADYPFGVGYRNYPYVSPRYLGTEYLTDGTRSAHNSVFTVACETGIPGLMFWLWALFGSIWLCRRIRKASRSGNVSRIGIYAIGIEIGLMGWFAGGLFNSDTELDPAYWCIAFAVVLTRLHWYAQNEEIYASEETEESTTVEQS